MENEELVEYMQMMNREFGPRGWNAGKGPPDMYGNQPTSSMPGWSDITRDQLRTNQFGPDLPSGLGLLSNREDAEQVLRSRLVDAEAPSLKQVPLMKDMLNTSGVPFWDDPETAGSKIPFPEQNPAWDQTNALYDQGQSNYYGPTGLQNRISPLPHQLEGPETAIGPMMAGGPPDMYGRQMAHRDLAYDPNQELYDPNYYGTPGQMGQMGSPSEIPQQVQQEGLLGPGYPGQNRTEVEGLRQQVAQGSLIDSPETSSAQGGKWEDDPKFRNLLAKYFWDTGTQIRGEPSKWR